MKRSCVTMLFFIFSRVVFSQSADWNTGERLSDIMENVDETKFDEVLMQDALCISLAAELKKINLEEFTVSEVLAKAARDYAHYLSTIDDAKPALGGKKELLSSRLQLYGGAQNSCEEICSKAAIKKGKDPMTFKEVAEDIVFRWMTSKTADIIKDPQYLIAGVGCKLDKAGKKVYVSVILGNYNTINDGVALIKTSGLPITTSSQGILPNDPKVCKACEKFRGIDSLQRCLVVEGKNIYLETDMKSFKKVMKQPDDGLAVDIVSKKQFECEKPNIIDKSLPSRGILLKMVTQEKMIANNLLTGKDGKTRIKVLLGTIPDGLGIFEVNLVVVQGGVFCRNIKPTFTEKFPLVGSGIPKILGDTLTFFDDLDYKPQPDTTFIVFTIPFAFGKSDYKQSDIKPMLEALKEPDFIIKSIKITAFSSVDGSEEQNEGLRMARAQSIINAMKQLQKGGGIKTDIITSDAWALFYRDLAGTNWAYLQEKSKDEVIEILKTTKPDDQLNRMLVRQRFARVEMGVVYDLQSVKKEQNYMLNKFQKALDSGDIVKALNFQKHIIKMIKRGVYSRYLIPEMNIPPDSVRFAGMQMNKLWIDYVANGRGLDTNFYTEVCRLSRLDPQNEYVAFNKLYYEITKFDVVDEPSIAQVQQKIEALRTSRLRKIDVDPLNVEFQLRILAAIGKTLKVTDEQKAVNDVLDRIKSIVDVNAGDWKNALNLAIVFYQMNDYDFPIQLLEPIILNTDADEKVLFTYLSACTHTHYKHLTRPFEIALRKAFEKNKTRTCELFDNGDFSFQLFENPNVKKLACEKCSE